ncbi:hypothetical protein H0H92_000333 [Tricholoma furcatifolium]|nr:hypothetical protein H0H92_000333 [Tricholoma furcatifolium]
MERSMDFQQRRWKSVGFAGKRRVKQVKNNQSKKAVKVKIPKGVKSFMPQQPSALTNPLFHSAERTTLELPSFNPIQNMIGQATEFPVSKNDPARIYGLPKKMLLEFRLLSKPCSVVRNITVSLANILDEAGRKDSSTSRGVLTGRSGCGKSFLMLQMVEHCAAKGWVVIYVPRAKKLVDSSTPHEYSLRTQTYLQPAYSLQTLRRIQETNESKFVTLATQNKHILEKREISAGTNLSDLISIALKEPALAPVILEIFMAELSKQTKVPVLLAVDDFQALYCRTAYHDPHFVPIRSHHLSVPRMIMEYASGKRTFSRGAFLGAISNSETLYKVPLELQDALNIPYPRFTAKQDKRLRTMQEYAEGLVPIEVPSELTLKEAASLYQVWKDDKALVSSAHDEVFLSKYAESSGNARDFVWKGILATLDTQTFSQDIQELD